MKMRLSGRNTCIALSILVLGLFGSSTYLSAWGPGHDDVNRIALDRLPADIKALLSLDDRKAFVKESRTDRKDRTGWPESVRSCRLPTGWRARFVFIPEYLISPWLLTDEPELSNLARSRLDQIGVTVLSTALNLLHRK